MTQAGIVQVGPFLCGRREDARTAREPVPWQPSTGEAAAPAPAQAAPACPAYQSRCDWFSRWVHIDDSSPAIGSRAGYISTPLLRLVLRQGVGDDPRPGRGSAHRFRSPIQPAPLSGVYSGQPVSESPGLGDVFGAGGAAGGDVG
eukprot:6559421-Pyramimonas_sp.AAC.1